MGAQLKVKKNNGSKLRLVFYMALMFLLFFIIITHSSIVLIFFIIQVRALADIDEHVEEGHVYDIIVKVFLEAFLKLTL